MGNSVTKSATECSVDKLQKSRKGQENIEARKSANFRKISVWSFGSLSQRLNWSFSSSERSQPSFFKQRTNTLRNYSRSSRLHLKTPWPTPNTDLLFLPHFKRHSRNECLVVKRVIAEGAFGVVFKVVDKQNTNIEYALKVVKKSKIIQENSVQQIKDEIDIQKLCGHHPFIVKQIDSWQNRSNLHILLEYISGGELFSRIQKFSLELIRLYVAEIALALDFLHNAGIIYRDVKFENILLTSHYHIKLADFGLSKWLKFGERTRTMCGTFQYMAPEILRGEYYSHAVDWWALGVVACRMSTEKYPNTALIVKYGQGDSDEREPILPQDVDMLPSEMKDLLIRLLEPDEKIRIKSILGLQKIAMYRLFKLEVQHVQEISVFDILSKSDTEVEHNFVDSEAFEGF